MIFNSDFAGKLDRLGAAGIPFLFVIDFEMQKPFLCQLDEAAKEGVVFDIRGFSNAEKRFISKPINLVRYPPAFAAYEKQFNYVIDRLNYGDSFLTNLTIRSEIEVNLSLKELFFASRAKYKLLFKDQFLVFSPETFVRISEGKIITNPMKGTIDASIPNASQRLLADAKEAAEHVTIVDLLRNDLSSVAANVEVTRLRYLEKVTTIDKALLQMSSEIAGDLPSGFESHIGEILFKLLPAGSVSGAPKPRTLKIIQQAEQQPRGYYTGVFGYFDGKTLDSGVMIRYIEKEGDKLFYRSGGGITAQSISESEYNEAIDKIYVPVD